MQQTGAIDKDHLHADAPKKPSVFGTCRVLRGQELLTTVVVSVHRYRIGGVPSLSLVGIVRHGTMHLRETV